MREPTALTSSPATGVEGIFRLSGSEKRIKELKTIFDSPDRYGKGLVWDGYTVHDAANVLRRYLNDLPEPVVPLDLYEKFREPLRHAATQAVGDAEGPQYVENFDVTGAIIKYQELITQLPPLNRQLLLYILDLLAVFAAKADENRMTSQNLAAIFQPGMLSHPQHAMAPDEYRLNQCVLIFLIENQDHFLIGMQGTEADEKTKQEVEQGTPPVSGPTTPNPNRKSGLGRSSSNASAGADSVRRDGKIRRNRSTSSRHSRGDGAETPGTPAVAATPTGGLARSNTVPSKKSPAIGAGRFQRYDAEHGSIEPLTQITSEDPTPDFEKSPASSSIVPASATIPGHAGVGGRSQEALLEPPTEATTPSKNLQSLFQRTLTSDSGRTPNKLKKKRGPDPQNPSAQSSQTSLHHHSTAVSPAVEVTDPMNVHDLALTEHHLSPADLSTGNTPSEPTPRASQVPSSNTLHPENAGKARSPPTSLHSSFNEGSDLDQVDYAPLGSMDAPEREKEKRKRWRLSRAKRDETSPHAGGLSSPRKILGANSNAEISSTSIGSAANKPRKSFTGDSSEPTLINSTEATGSTEQSGREGGEPGGRGPIGWIRSKYREAKENAEQRRNKSPPAERHMRSASSLLPNRGKSLDIKREEERQAGQGPLSPQFGGQPTTHPPVPPLPTVVAPPLAQQPQQAQPYQQPAPVQAHQEWTERIGDAS